MRMENFGLPMKDSKRQLGEVFVPLGFVLFCFLVLVLLFGLFVCFSRDSTMLGSSSYPYLTCEVNSYGKIV